MGDLHSMGWYATRLTPHLPAHIFRPVPERLWGGLAYLVIALAAGAAVVLADLHWLARLGLAFVIGQCFAGLGFLGHEILHGSVVRSHRLRDVLGAICMAQFSLGTRLWRHWHNAQHHGHTQMPGIDPDAFGTMEGLYSKPPFRFLYRFPAWVRNLVTFAGFSLIFSLHSFMLLVRFSRRVEARERAVMWLQWAVPTLFWLALLLWLGPVQWLFIYVVPLLIANWVVIAYISTNHQLNPHTDVNDPLANSLSVTVPRWVDVLHFNFSYHTEHHVFAHMNPKWAPLVKARLKEFWPERYHEMPMHRALVALWKTPRVYHEQVNLVDIGSGVTYPTLGHGLDPNDVRPRAKLARRPKAGKVRAV